MLDKAVLDACLRGSILGEGARAGGRAKRTSNVCLTTHALFSLRLSGRQAAQSRAVPLVPFTRLRRLGYDGASGRAKLLKFGRASESRRPPGAAREGRQRVFSRRAWASWRGPSGARASRRRCASRSACRRAQGASPAARNRANLHSINYIYLTLYTRGTHSRFLFITLRVVSQFLYTTGKSEQKSVSRFLFLGF